MTTRGPAPSGPTDDAPRWMALGALMMALAVAVGAFGAHGLRDRLSPDLLTVWETGARYHAYHALGLFAVAAVAMRRAASPRIVRIAGWAMLAGIVVFSGSLYLLAVTGMRWLGAITPLGGASWIAAWTLLAVGCWRGTKRANLPLDTPSE